MPITKEAIADAAIAYHIASDADVDAWDTPGEEDAYRAYQRAKRKLSDIVAEYRRQPAEPPTSASVEPRV